jgi:hypothetical protein
MPRGSELDLNTRGWERWVPNFNSIYFLLCAKAF